MNPTTPLCPQFLFDFASPNAYMCHRLIPAIESRTNKRFAYQPIFLGGLFKLSNNRPPFETFADVPNKIAFEKLEMQRFVSQHRLDAFRFNPNFPISTLPLMRGAVAAQRLDCFERYVEMVFVAMWERGLKMDDPATIETVLTEGGMDAEFLMKTAQYEEIKDALTENTQAACEGGAFGVPTFFVGDEMFFGKECLHAVEEKMVIAP